jgi:hypothetical protein
VYSRAACAIVSRILFRFSGESGFLARSLLPHPEKGNRPEEELGMTRQRKVLPARKLQDRSRDDDSLLLRSAESLGRVIGALQRQLDGATRRLSQAGNGQLRVFRSRAARKSAPSRKPSARQPLTPRKASAKHAPHSSRDSARPAPRAMATKRKSSKKR